MRALLHKVSIDARASEWGKGGPVTTRCNQGLGKCRTLWCELPAVWSSLLDGVRDGRKLGRQIGTHVGEGQHSGQHHQGDNHGVLNH